MVTNTDANTVKMATSLDSCIFYSIPITHFQPEAVNKVSAVMTSVCTHIKCNRHLGGRTNKVVIKL